MKMNRVSVPLVATILAFASCTRTQPVVFFQPHKASTIHWKPRRPDQDPLLYACGTGDAVTVKKLLAAGKDPNASTKGYSALHFAVRADSLEIVKELVQAKAKLNTPDHATGATPLHLAAMLNEPDIYDYLLQCGADPHVRDKAGYTPDRSWPTSTWKRP